MVGHHPMNWTVGLMNSLAAPEGSEPNRQLGGSSGPAIETSQEGVLAGQRWAAPRQGGQSGRPVNPKRQGAAAVHDSYRAQGKSFAAPRLKARSKLKVKSLRRFHPPFKTA